MRTNENYLRWQFGRWAREFAPNVTLLDGTDAAGVDLEPGEATVARITVSPDGSPLLLTDRRIVLPDGRAPSFADVRHCHWFDRNPKASCMDKRHYQRMVLEMNDGREVVLDGLGQAVFPLLKFFWFKLGCHRDAATAGARSRGLR